MSLIIGVIIIFSIVTLSQSTQPIIFDTDYGEFIDDVFALGLILNSRDLLDLKYVITTSEDPAQSAQCVAKHLHLAGVEKPIGQGRMLPDVSLRSSVCYDNGHTKLGMPLATYCNEGSSAFTYDEDGVEALAQMLEESDRDDWLYVVVGAQTSLRALIEEYPKQAGKISTLIVMGGNWCIGFQPYLNVDAPTDEANIACDPASANAVLSASTPFEEIYYVPVAVADVIDGNDYMKFINAAQSGANLGAQATLRIYQAWSEAARMDEKLVTFEEAWVYDPLAASTSLFDACAIMLALQLLDDKICEDRMKAYEIKSGVHFVELRVGDDDDDDGMVVDLANSPRGGFSLLPKGFEITELPDQCPGLTQFTFEPFSTPEKKSVMVALGYTSQRAKDSLFSEMVERIAGSFPKYDNGQHNCYVIKEEKTDTINEQSVEL